ncbi:MAG TPA: glycerophosphodiester phosphodiesterase family protein [Clostridia bacterium]
MRFYLIQPPYPITKDMAQKHIDFILRELENCPMGVDCIVLPEYTGSMGQRQRYASLKESCEIILTALRKTISRVGCMAVVNMAYPDDNTQKFKNTTLLLNRKGEIAAEYCKQHLPISEKQEPDIDYEYSKEYRLPEIIEIEGVKASFLTCYDVYFSEYIEQIARHNIDVLFICSFQRAELKSVLETQAKYCAYRCNAFVIRSSVSMGEGSKTGGCSMVAAPWGEIILNMEQKTGSAIVDINPKEKHKRSNGFGKPMILSQDYIEQGRTPWCYRPSGPSIVLPDELMPYPRVCAHRGFNTIAPENTMPAFGAAVALGAQEIELDLWPTKDGKLVVIHDNSLDRTTDKKGKVYEMTYSEILEADVGVKFSPYYSGLRVPLFEDVLRKFACQTIINIHIKSLNADEYDRETFKKIIELIKYYDCEKYVYIAGEEDVLKVACELAPDIARCAIDDKRDYTVVDLAIKYHCQKVQFFKPYFTQEMINKARQNNIICNVFWADDPQEAVRYLNMGIDTILTNDYLRVKTEIQKSMK